MAKRSAPQASPSKPSLGTITREGVLAAMAEFDELGREAFLKKYGFGRSARFVLKYRRRSYDSKALVGVAYGYTHGVAALSSREFSGGAATVQRVLDRLKFTTEVADA